MRKWDQQRIDLLVIICAQLSLFFVICSQSHSHLGLTSHELALAQLSHAHPQPPGAALVSQGSVNDGGNGAEGHGGGTRPDSASQLTVPTSAGYFTLSPGKYQENGDTLSDFVNLVCQEAQGSSTTGPVSIVIIILNLIELWLVSSF